MPGPTHWIIVFALLWAFVSASILFELVHGLDESLLEEPSLEYGFILHDIGKIGIPDRVLGKRSSLVRQCRVPQVVNPLLPYERVRSVE